MMLCPNFYSLNGPSKPPSRSSDTFPVTVAHLHFSAVADGQHPALADVQRRGGARAQVRVQRLQHAQVPQLQLAVRTRRGQVAPAAVDGQRRHRPLHIQADITLEPL